MSSFTTWIYLQNFYYVNHLNEGIRLPLVINCNHWKRTWNIGELEIQKDGAKHTSAIFREGWGVVLWGLSLFLKQIQIILNVQYSRPWSFWTHLRLNNMAEILQMPFWNAFPWNKALVILYFFIFKRFCSKSLNWRIVSIGSGNGLVSTWRQAIT